MKLLARLISCWATIVAGQMVFAAQTNTLISITGPWRYNTNNLDGVAWKAASYNDSAWPGPSNALLYIETGTVPAAKNTPLPPRPSTSLPYNAYYFRSAFVVSNVADVNVLVFSNLVDDGAVFYLNGTEVQCLYMPSGTITYTNLSSASHEASAYDVFTLTGDALTNLVEGTNVLAVEVHQTSASSTDIVFGSALAEVRGANVSLARGPYLQLSTPSSIVIRWRTTVGANSRIIYGTNLAALNLTNTILSSVGEHIVTLTNLQPDTKYYYSVGSTTTNLAPASSNQFFLTHPLPGTPKPLRVWVIGDAGTVPYGPTYAADQVAVRNSFETWNGTNVVHAWLQLGDNAYPNGTDAEFQAAVFNIYTNELRNSVTWPTLGNHDTAQGTSFVDTYPYFSIFTLPTAGEAGGVPSTTEHYYSFDIGMVHFICLDSMTADRATNGAMATWLRSDLAVTTNRWIVAYWHHPPYTKGSHNSDSETVLVQMRTNFLPILEAGGVDLVLAGHSHSYERSFLINGHYGLSTSFSTNLIVQTGSGRETNGIGAYLKRDTLGSPPVANHGAVYAVAGSSGQISGGSLNHPAMFYSTNALGSMILDFNSNRLDVTFLRETNTLISDYFTLIKSNAVATISGNVKLQAFLGSSRQVRFIASAVAAGTTNYLQTNEVNLNFTGGEGGYHIQAPLNTTHVSAKTAWHLRKRLPVTIVDGAATVNFTGANWLLGGDIVTAVGSTNMEDSDNLVNAVDLGLLLGYYLNSVGADPMIGRADIDADPGADLVNAVDLSVLLGNYLVLGDEP